MSKRGKLNVAGTVEVLATIVTGGAASVAATVKHTLASWAVTLVRAIVAHQNDGAVAFLTNPAPFLGPDAGLTTAQRCNLFNFAMSVAGVNLKMPTDAAGEKAWDGPTFERGMALAHGRTISRNHWASQKYQPLKVPGRKPLRSFYVGLTEAARTGLLTDVDASQFAGLDGEALQEALRTWFGAVVGDGKTPGTLTGSKAKPGPLAYSFRSLAIRADLPKLAPKRGKRGATTAASLLAEYGPQA